MGPVDARLAEINERECERVALTFTENRYRYMGCGGNKVNCSR